MLGASERSCLEGADSSGSISFFPRRVNKWEEIKVVNIEMTMLVAIGAIKRPKCGWFFLDTEVRWLPD